jgi:hypothetical protein
VDCLDQKKIIDFLSYWISTSVILIGISTVFSNNVVLGTDKLARPMAGVLAAFLITLAFTFVPDFIEKNSLKIKNERIWPAIFFVSNALVIWIIKRFALVTGLGVSNIFFVLVAAALITIGQWVVGKGLGSISQSNK